MRATTQHLEDTAVDSPGKVGLEPQESNRTGLCVSEAIDSMTCGITTNRIIDRRGSRNISDIC